MTNILHLQKTLNYIWPAKTLKQATFQKFKRNFTKKQSELRT